VTATNEPEPQDPGDAEQEVIMADVVALWRLCVYGSRENMGVA
jgi:hypothetical protein